VSRKNGDENRGSSFVAGGVKPRRSKFFAISSWLSGSFQERFELPDGHGEDPFGNDPSVPLGARRFLMILSISCELGALGGLW